MFIILTYFYFFLGGGLSGHHPQDGRYSPKAEYPYYPLLQVRRLFRVADKDGDGKLTTEEWRHVLTQSGVKTTQLGSGISCTCLTW